MTYECDHILETLPIVRQADVEIAGNPDRLEIRECTSETRWYLLENKEFKFRGEHMEETGKSTYGLLMNPQDPYNKIFLKNLEDRLGKTQIPTHIKLRDGTTLNALIAYNPDFEQYSALIEYTFSEN